MKSVTAKKILFVEDDAELLCEMTSYFSALQNTVFAAATLEDAKKQLGARSDIDIIVLDVVLPDGTGLDLVKFSADKLPPVVVLSDLGSEENILEGFESGVVDYVVKPCSMKLLETRLSLRLLPKNEARIAIGDFAIDSASRIVRYRDCNISLTASEFNILFFLASHADTFFTANQIYESVWNMPSLNTSTIKRHLSTIRQKLKDIQPQTALIETKFGQGYAFRSGEKHEKSSY